MTSASWPPFLDTATEFLTVSASSFMGKDVEAVARPRRTCGKEKKEPKSKLKRFGRAEVKAVKVIKRRQT